MELTIALSLVGFMAVVLLVCSVQYFVYWRGQRQMPRELFADKRPKKPTWL